MCANHYGYGRKKEEKVVKSLRGSGYSCALSNGSRGASDIKCEKDGRKWNIQVKATRSSEKSPQISSEEIRRLKIQASRNGALPVLAEVIRGDITYTSLKSGRKLKP